MRVLQVITTTSRRGAELHASDLHDHLLALGLDVATVALVDGTAPTLDVPVLGRDRLARTTLRRLRRLTGDASVVVAHGSTTLPATALATIGQRTPFIYRSIGDPLYWSPTTGRRLRSAALLRRARLVVGLTDETVARLIRHYRLPADRVICIPPGIDPAAFPRRDPVTRACARERFGYTDDVRLAVCVGALSPEKAVHNAVLAMAALPTRWHLAVAGDGPDRDTVARAASSFGPRVRLLGQITDPAELMAAADVLLLPSLTEGVPGVVIEAASIGVPAVVTDVGFVSSVVADGVTGAIVPPGSPSALAKGLLACEPHLEAMGEAAADRAARYSLPAVAPQWMDAINRVHPNATGGRRRS